VLRFSLIIEAGGAGVATISSIGKYQVLGTLGKGAHSTILHVRRSADSRDYALKIVPLEDKDDGKYLDQARHEHRVAQRLGHPNLIKVYCLELKRDWLFRVRQAEVLIEYVHGTTLDAIPIPQDQLVTVFAQIAAGLAHMHRRGVFHADLKPNNVLYGKRGEVKIIDYGLAWIKGEPKDRVQGTPEYMAPETARSRIINERTDIYNLGATMYRLTTLKLPPSALPASESLRLNAKAFSSMLTPVYELNKGVPKSLADLIHRCLEYDADKRPERVGLILDDLKQIAADQGTPISDEE
jgi:serine/threonine protein kinase